MLQIYQAACERLEVDVMQKEVPGSTDYSSLNRDGLGERWLTKFQMVTTGCHKYRPLIAIGLAGLSINLWVGLYSIRRGLMPGVRGGAV